MFLDVDDADLQAKLLEPHSPNWFCHDVCQLIVGLDMPDGDLPALDVLPDEMEARLDVFTPAMEDRILAKLDRRLVVDEERASHEERATTSCLLECHETGAEPRKKMPPEVLLRSS